MSKKYVYLFTEGNASMRELLGGKGANLAEMTNLGLPVPQGFTISTEACTQYYEDGRRINDEIQAEIMEYIEKMEQITGKKFGDQENPLLVSVRSGARASMPGMMDTILNLGLNEDVVEVMAKKSGNPRWAYDCYRRFIQMYSDVVMEVGKKYFEQLIDEMKEARGVTLDTELTADDLKELAEKFKAEYREKLGEDRVLFDEGFDRVRIRSEKTGKYLRIAENGAVYADADENTADLFERADWDFGAWTLRSVRTGKYLTEDKNFFDETPQDENAVTIDPGMNCTADVVFGWFVKELLYAKEEDGVLYLDTWQHRAVSVNDENKLVAKAGSGDCPCKQFTLEVVSSGAERVAELAQRADHVIVCAGNQPLINAREEYDRPDIRLPKAQTALLNAAAAANESTLLYLVTGYPFAINKEKDTAKAVLCSTHLGPCLGHVAAATVFGENNPAGRTPTTWYRSVRDLPALDDYDIAKNHVTYLYFRGKPLYAFGYGLSYTTFAYSNLTVKQENGEVIATVNVQNTGALDGDEVVQLYMSLPGSLRVRPIHALKAFKRVHIKAGETVTVTLNFKIDDLAVWCNGRKIYTVESGVYKMEVGAASDDIRLTADVEIAGEAFPGRPGFFKQEAIDADDYSGVTFLTDKRDGETYVEAKDFRSFLVYKNMDLTGCNAFECAMSAPSGDVEILLADNKTGKVLGKAGGTGTGSLTKFTSFTCDIAAEAGLTELRIVFTKQTSLKWFRFYTV